MRTPVQDSRQRLGDGYAFPFPAPGERNSVERGAAEVGRWPQAGKRGVHKKGE
jgi:hypothetical protein